MKFFYLLIVILAATLNANGQITSIQVFYKFIPTDANNTIGFQPGLKNYSYRQFIVPVSYKELTIEDSISYSESYKRGVQIDTSLRGITKIEVRKEQRYFKNGMILKKLVSLDTSKKKLTEYKYSSNDSLFVVSERLINLDPLLRDTTNTLYFFSRKDSLLVRKKIIKSTYYEVFDFNFEKHDDTFRPCVIFCTFTSNSGNRKYRDLYQYHGNSALNYTKYVYTSKDTGTDFSKYSWVSLDTIHVSHQHMKAGMYETVTFDQSSSERGGMSNRIEYYFDDGFIQQISFVYPNEKTDLYFKRFDDSTLLTMQTKNKTNFSKVNNGTFLLTRNEVNSYDIKLYKPYYLKIFTGTQYHILNYSLTTKIKRYEH